MEFIYRMPLLDFDVLDDAAVHANYQRVLAGIAVASPSFYQCIKDRTYQDLREKERVTVLKYMLRGRYRAVPFGLWAGAGLGRTGSKQNITPLEPIYYVYDVSNTCAYGAMYGAEYEVISGLSQCDRGYQFWGFDVDRKRWVERVVPSNVLTESLSTFWKEGRSITFSKFGKLFEGVSDEVIRGFWIELLTCGLLQPVGIGNFLNQKPRILSKIEEVMSGIKPQMSLDTHLDNEVMIDENQVASLSLIPKEMGNLFTRRHSSSIQRFIHAFLKDHDDRIVGFDELNRPYSAVSNMVQTGISPGDSVRKIVRSTALMTFLLGRQFDRDVDLSKWLKHKPMPKTPEVTVLFKMGSSQLLSIDHITCGRGMAYCGRTTLNAKFQRYAQRLGQKYYSAPDVHFASVDLLESEQVSRLAIHQTIFPFSIVLHRNPVAANEIGSSEILIGVLDKEIELVYAKTGKRLVPVFAHAVNPAYISHPLVLLMWIVAHQYSFSLRDEILADIPGITHMPRLRWKNIILRPESWYIRGNRDMGLEGMVAYLATHKVPRYVLTGENDQELFLDLEHGYCLQVLLGAIRKQERVILKENNWFVGNSDSVKGRTTPYPQFVTSLGTAFKWKGLGRTFVNVKEAEDTAWLAYHIYIKQSESIWFLTTYIWPIMEGLEKRKLLMGWYYLVYKDADFHIRLRMRPLKPSLVRNEVAGLLSEIRAVERMMGTSYFPEFKKYGYSGRMQSEYIFHFESQLAIGGKVVGFRFPTPLILEEEYRVFQLLVDMFYNLLNHFELLAVCLADFDLHVFNRLSSPEKKRLIGNYTKMQKMNAAMALTDYEGSTELTEAYIRLYENHERIQLGEESVLFVKNHLHMFVNRIFPDISLEVERLIWFALSRNYKRERFAVE